MPPLLDAKTPHEIAVSKSQQEKFELLGAEICHQTMSDVPGPQWLQLEANAIDGLRWRPAR